MNETMQEYAMSDRIWEQFAASEEKWLDRFCELLSLRETPLVLMLPDPSPNAESKFEVSQSNRISQTSGRIFEPNTKNTDQTAWGQLPEQVQTIAPQQFPGRENPFGTAPEMSEEGAVSEMFLPHGDENDPEQNSELFREMEAYLEQAILEELGSSVKGVY